MALHGANHRARAGDDAQKLSRRLSRHAYDVAMIARSKIGEEVIEQSDVLDEVRKHTDVFFHQSKLRCDLAKRGSFSLAPVAELERALRADYSEMGPMLFGEPPTFDEILTELQAAELKINQRH